LLDKAGDHYRIRHSTGTGECDIGSGEQLSGECLVGVTDVVDFIQADRGLQFSGGVGSLDGR
jgi:hypothetical protein